MYGWSIPLGPEKLVCIGSWHGSNQSTPKPIDKSCPCLAWLTPEGPVIACDTLRRSIGVMDNSRQFYEYHSQVPCVSLFVLFLNLYIYYLMFLLSLQHSEESWTLGRMPQDRLQPHDMQSYPSMQSTPVESEHLRFYVEPKMKHLSNNSKYIKCNCEHHKHVLLLSVWPWSNSNRRVQILGWPWHLASNNLRLFGHDTLPHKNTQHT